MMEAMFKKEDIKAGYLLRWEDLGDGETLYTTVLPCAGTKVPPFLAFLVGDAVINREDGALACCGDGEYWPLSAVQDDLRIVRKEEWQCVEIWGYTAPKFLLTNSTRMRELLWKRGEGESERCDRCRCGESRDEAEENCTCDEPVEAAPVKLTIDEICQRLGYQVEIAEEATACGGDGYVE